MKYDIGYDFINTIKENNYEADINGYKIVLDKQDKLHIIGITNYEIFQDYYINPLIIIPLTKNNADKYDKFINTNYKLKEDKIYFIVHYDNSEKYIFEKWEEAMNFISLITNFIAEILKENLKLNNKIN